ncbi:MAG: IS630 family transposase [Dyella sp.]|nr:IS630 family transposase [Dyella sp.]
MRTGRPKAVLVLTEGERAQLEALASNPSSPAKLGKRARIVLGSADGNTNSEIARQLRISNATVGKWRARFIARRIAGLRDNARPGAPRTIGDERLARLIQVILHTRPPNGSRRWSVRAIAAATGIAKSSVQRYSQRFGLQPHRRDDLNLSIVLDEMTCYVVGLYLDPSGNALVLYMDGSEQRRAPERALWRLSGGPGNVEVVTHDHARHGTPRSSEALNSLDSAGPASCRPYHCEQEFLSFLRETDLAVPGDVDIHGIAYKQAVIDYPKVEAWLAQRPRWHIHVTPANVSWLNQVERLIALIADESLRRNVCTDSRKFALHIDHFVATYNAVLPFCWIATADSILERLNRLYKGINGTSK